MPPIPCFFSQCPCCDVRKTVHPETMAQRFYKPIRKLNYLPSGSGEKSSLVKLVVGWVGGWSWQLFVVLESWGWNMYVYLSPSSKNVDNVLATEITTLKNLPDKDTVRGTADSKRKPWCSSHEPPCQWLNPLNPHWASLEGLPGCLSDFSFSCHPRIAQGSDMWQWGLLEGQKIQLPKSPVGFSDKCPCQRLWSAVPSLPSLLLLKSGCIFQRWLGDVEDLKLPPFRLPEWMLPRVAAIVTLFCSTL